MQRSLIYITIIFAIFSSCSRRPGYVMSEDKMVDVLCDIRLAEVIYRDGDRFNTTKKKDALVAGILEKHNITQAELDSSLLWYSDNIDQYINITDSVASRLKAKSELVMASRIALDSRHRKSSNYLIPSFFYLNESTPTMSFNIDSVKIKEINLSSFSLKFDVQGLSNRQKAEAAIYFTYKDTLIRRNIPIDKNTNYIFTKPNLADSLLKSISGYIHIRNKTTIPSNVLLYNITYTDSTAISLIEENPVPIPRHRDSSPKEHQVEKELLNSTDSKRIQKPTVEETENLPVISKERLERNHSLRNRRQIPKQ